MLHGMDGIEMNLHIATIDINNNLLFFSFIIFVFIFFSYRGVIAELSGGKMLADGTWGSISLHRSPEVTTTVGRRGLPA